MEFIKSVIESPGKILASMSPTASVEERKQGILTVLTPQNKTTSQPAPPMDIPQDGFILVTGATGGVGKRVVARLLASGRKVRALVRDKAKGQTMLSSLPVAPGGVLELVAADITQKSTLLPEMFEGVRGVISASAVKVAPKEGDTEDRAKYMQGIKFFDPMIVGDTPESVEFIGLKNVMDAVQKHLGVYGGQTLLSAAGVFGSSPAWGPLDDVVMGGVSNSELVEVAGAGENGATAVVFRGTVSVNNSGGFVSVRSKNWIPGLYASPYQGLELRVLGNGLRYKAILRTETNWDGVGYTKSFDTVAGVWQTIRVPFSDFIPVFRAKVVGDKPLNPASIASMQLMLSKFEYDGGLNPAFSAGPFELPIQSIKTYLPDNVAPRFVHLSSAGVTRPDRPGINVDVEPPAVKMNAMLGGILTWKLAGEDVVRTSGVPAAVVRPTALTEEGLGAPLQVDQGDVIKGKISREEVAELCCALLGLPAAAGVTFEVKSTVPFSQPWEGEAAGAGSVPRDWGELLSGLEPGVTGKTVDGVYTGKNKESDAGKMAQTV